MLKAWDEETPPRQTWVAARYGVMEPDHIVKTCKHGCCVIDPLCGSMMLPAYWRLATDAEVSSVLPRPKTPNDRVEPGAVAPRLEQRG